MFRDDKTPSLWPREGERGGARTGRMEERSTLFGLFARREISWNNTRRGAAAKMHVKN